MSGRFFKSYTMTLVTINVIAFFITLVLDYFYFSGSLLIEYLAIQPSSFLQGRKLWTILTSMFMHAGVWHLFANMVTLIFIGGFVEKLIGKKRFISLYFIGGLIASLFFVFLAGFFGTGEWGLRLFGSPDSLAVGASGAIFALGGLLAVLTPKLRVLVFFVIPMPMWIAMIGLVFVIWTISLGVPFGIGNTAHFGGLVVGVVYGFYLRKKYPRKTRMIARYFSN